MDGEARDASKRAFEEFAKEHDGVPMLRAADFSEQVKGEEDGKSADAGIAFPCGVHASSSSTPFIAPSRTFVLS
eukprot:10288103-Prorocentrum_lima.AAC.1